MGIQYLKKAVKTASTDDTKTRDIVQKLLSELENLKKMVVKNLQKNLINLMERQLFLKKKLMK